MDFVGLQMVVTLRNPQGAQLKGTVSEVTPGQSLVLSNVFTVGTDKWIPRLTLDPGNIADVAEYRDPIAPSTFAPPIANPVPAPVVSQPAQPAFIDPAIVSLGKRPGSGSVSRTASENPTPVPLHPYKSRPQSPAVEPARAAGLQPGQPGVLTAGILAGSQAQAQPAVAAALQEDFESMHIHEASRPRAKAPERNDKTGSQDVSNQAKKKNRRSRAGKANNKNGGAIGEESAFDGTESVQGKHGKGWRQTPILQHNTSSFQPFKALKKNGKKGGADNGWASEDVTEEMGEFDFEGNLTKFDKRTIFDQMRKEDLVDEAERLVSHNRKPKPGTAGGKNLHYSENVLDVPQNTGQKTANDFWNSEADDNHEAAGVGAGTGTGAGAGVGAGAGGGAERLSGRDVRSSQSMRRTDSKSGTVKRSQSRKASGTAAAPPTTRVNSSQSNHGFYLVPSYHRAETVSALQMLNLENIAANEIGLTEDMMAENAGRGIAQVSLTALADPAIQVRLGMGGANGRQVSAASMATIVILAGNNKSGIRAVAAARHLRNKGVTVLVCVVGIERERDLLEDMRQQIRIFKNMGGRIHNKIELFEQLRKVSHSTTTTVALIIDALLGLAISFEELRTGDQATVYELIEWANRNEAFTLAVDVPTGIDPSTGKVSIIDGSRLYVKPRYVVCMGAPKRGLLEAMAPSQEEDAIDDGLNGGSAPAADGDEWRLFIADIGLGAAVWKKAGTKLRRGIDFDDRWVLEMRYRGAHSSFEDDY